MIWILLSFNILAFLMIFPASLFSIKGKTIFTLAGLSLQVILSSFIAYQVFNHGLYSYTLSGTAITGEIPIRIDYLSAWFILIFNFTFITGAFYGIQYLKKYRHDNANLGFHAISYIFVYTSMINLTMIQNSLVFIILWEIMALSSFVLIIFEYHKRETLKTGINFMIQSHVSILLLTFGFIIIKINTGTFDFSGISTYTTSGTGLSAIGIFLLLFIGFAIKAGFVPFHTWLPHAHPAAPAHVSGVMSGVIIKIGIYGILRLIMLIRADMIFIGYFILVLSIITGVYGVMLAIVQHNLKRLLAYHSIENIGIIGMGIGLGCLGLEYQNAVLVILGFLGALLHTLNHSLFKSLLFFSAGNIYHASHTMNIDSLGGLFKKMPVTGLMFLIGSLAICGLPPFNGFVSEFLIFSGFFKAIHLQSFAMSLMMVFSIIALVLIGGLAIMCFTKAFGITFLGMQRSKDFILPETEKLTHSIPQYLIVLMILGIGIVPVLFLKPAYLVISQIAPWFSQGPELFSMFEMITQVGFYSLIFILIVVIIYVIKKWITSGYHTEYGSTWGCGYTGEIPRAQYTATSFIRTYRQIASPVIGMHKHRTESDSIFPQKIHHETHPFDKLEYWMIDKPIHLLRKFLSRFTFLQNGNIQTYILYGFVFITIIVLIPTIILKFKWLFDIFN